MKEETKKSLKKLFLNWEFIKLLFILLIVILVLMLPRCAFDIAEGKLIVTLIILLLWLFQSGRWVDSLK
ncbi:MAG: hypothetical protein ACOC56_04115 [Atribacterota bacterium]